MRRKPIYDYEEYTLAFQRGEEKGFDFFYRQLFPSLCFFANRKLNDIAEAEDITSGAFIKIWKRHTQFSNASNIRSYLYQIVRNDCLKFHEQKRHAVTLHNEISYLTNVDPSDQVEADIIRAEFLNQLYKTLNSLPKQCRKVFKMLYIQGKTIGEIADELNLSPSTIRSQKATGLVILRKKIVPLLFFFLLIFLGVGFLIRGRALRGPQDGKWSSTSSF